MLPVLILTARDGWPDKVDGFKAGAGDDLTKPFRIEELILRLRALVRRSAGHAASVIRCGPLDGVAAGIFGVIAIVIASDLMHGTGRFNLAQGLVALCVGVGADLSNLISGFIVERAGYPAGFLALAAIVVAALVFFAALMPETGDRRSEPPQRAAA